MTIVCNANYSSRNIVQRDHGAAANDTALTWGLSLNWNKTCHRAFAYNILQEIVCFKC